MSLWQCSWAIEVLQEASSESLAEKVCRGEKENSVAYISIDILGSLRHAQAASSFAAGHIGLTHSAGAKMI